MGRTTRKYSFIDCINMIYQSLYIRDRSITAVLEFGVFHFVDLSEAASFFLLTFAKCYEQLCFDVYPDCFNHMSQLLEAVSTSTYQPN